jgi:hypothetical protein
LPQIWELARYQGLHLIDVSDGCHGQVAWYLGMVMNWMMGTWNIPWELDDEFPKGFIFIFGSWYLGIYGYMIPENFGIG